MPSNPWHPKLPTSAKARRMIEADESGMALSAAGGMITANECDTPCREESDARFIIGTVAMQLCWDMWEKSGGKTRWFGVGKQWQRWAQGWEDWEV